MTRRLLSLALIVLALGVIAAPANASWNLASGGSGYGKAHSLPAGNTPTVAVTGRNVTVSWSGNTLPNGAGVQDYRVRRYDTAGVLQSISSGCDAFIPTLSCTEPGVPAGSWRYTVAPRQGNWIGAESAIRSVSVAAPSLSFSSSTNITSLPSVLSGNLSGFRTGTSPTFRLDNASTGTLLSGTVTPSTIPTNGTASFSLTIPKGVGSGAHTVYATDGQGESAGSAINVNIAAPTPTSLTTTNAGGTTGTGRIAQGDSFQVVYSQQLDVTSLCSTWSGDTTNQAINTDNAITVAVNNNAGATGNDTMTLVAAAGTCGGTFGFGSIDLGTAGFVNSNATFGGAGSLRSSLTWTPSTRTLAVTLGGLTGTAPTRLTSSLTAVYTPSTSIRNTNWIPITGTVSRTGVLF